MQKTILTTLCLALIFSLSCSQGSRMNALQTRNDRATTELPTPPAWLTSAVEKLEEELVAQYGDSQRYRIQRGLNWNRFYAPVFGKKDVILLGIYSHMIHSFLYLPDYPLGHIIAFQLEEYMKKAGKIGLEFERMARQGAIAPDLWMRGAVGSPVGPEVLLAATERALSLAKN